MRPSRLLLLASVLAALSLVVLIVWSSLRGGTLGSALSGMLQQPWELTTLVDLYVGLLFISVWIWFVERHPARWALWTLALLLTGNLATAVYLAIRAWRADSLAAVFTSGPPRAQGRGE